MDNLLSIWNNIYLTDWDVGMARFARRPFQDHLFCPPPHQRATTFLLDIMSSANVCIWMFLSIWYMYHSSLTGRSMWLDLPIAEYNVHLYDSVDQLLTPVRGDIMSVTSICKWTSLYI